MLALVKWYDEKAPNLVAQPPKRAKKRKFKKRVFDYNDNTPREALTINESETDLCKLIWQAVVVQALYDLANKNDKAIAMAASSWFAGGQGSDFEMVCDLANISKPLVLKKMREVLKDGEKALEGFNCNSLRNNFLEHKRGK
jgi:hypothetical protein